MDPITLGYSSCPNDTFIFEALMHNRLGEQELDLQPFIADVEELNLLAAKGVLPVTKMSFAAWLHLSDQYQLLDSGSALGHNCGPLIIAKDDFPFSSLAAKKVAIPGVHTTANLLLSLAAPEARQKQEYLFSDIEKTVLDGEADAGLVIHESRFTYADRGLVKIIDLGEWWEQETGHPIPLGGIFVLRSLPLEVKQKINRLIRESLEFAWREPATVWPYIKSLAQETADDVINSHIRLYVNDYSLSLGESGRAAVELLARKAKEAGYVSGLHDDLFVFP